MATKSIAIKANQINVKNAQGQWESTFPAASLTIVSDRPLEAGKKYKGTYTVNDLEYGDGEFRTEATIHREQPDRKYFTLAETENGSLKLNAKRVRMLLEMPYAAIDNGQDIAAAFTPQAREMLRKLRKIDEYLCDVHACKVIETAEMARAEAEREKNLNAVNKRG